ncbi:hypothetical protein SPURM210S_01545 [Streptomyces purpurascens]
MRGVGTVLTLVILATVVATFARRWRIPAPSLLGVAEPARKRRPRVRVG